MRRHLPVSILVVALAVVMAPITAGTAFGAIDLQGDLDRIVAAIAKFDANSSNAFNSPATIADVRRIFSNNALILKEIDQANSNFKRDINSGKKFIPTKDTKDSPAFTTLINLTKGYEDWLKYQYLNQKIAEKCLKNSGNSVNGYLSCSLLNFQKSMDNETVGRYKLETAWKAWKNWQVKFGYA